MAEAMKVRCSECDSELTLKDQSAIGKKVRCPFCSEPFVVKAPQKTAPARKQSPKKRPASGKRPQKSSAGRSAPPKKRRKKPVRQFDELELLDESPDYEDYDDYESEEDFDDFGALPPPRPQRSRKKRKRKKSSAAWMKPMLMVCGIVMGVGVIGGAVYFGLSWIGIIGGRLDLAYLPPDTNTIRVHRYSALWNSNLVQSALDKDDLSSDLAEWRKKYGLEPADIESVTDAQSGRGTDRKSIQVIRTHKPMDRDKLLSLAKNKEEVTHNGQTYHKIGSDWSIYFPDEKTAVMGSEDVVKQAIEAGPEPPDIPEFNFVDGSHHIVNAKSSQTESGLSETGLFQQFGGLARSRNLPDWDGVITASSSEQSWSSGVKQVSRYVCKETDSAADAVEKMKKTHRRAIEDWPEEKKKFREQIENAASLMKVSEEEKEKRINTVLEQAEDVLKGIGISRSGKTVILSVSMPKPPQFDEEKIRVPSQMRIFITGRGRNLFGKLETLGSSRPTLSRTFSSGNSPSRVNPQPKIQAKQPVSNPPSESNLTGSKPNNSRSQPNSQSPSPITSPGNFTNKFGNPNRTAAGRFPFGNRIWQVEFRYSSFSGQRGQQMAARGALADIPGVLTASVQVLPGLNIIRLSLRTNSVDTGPMKSALEKAGFVITSSSVR